MQVKALHLLGGVMLLATTVLGQIPASSPCDSTPPAPTPASARASLLATVPIEVNNNHVFVAVCHGERPLTFILDTGAPFSALDLTTARQQGVPLGEGFSASGAGAGSAAAAVITGVTVRLAGTAIANSPTRAIDFSSVARRDGHRLDGLLGRDLIERFVLRVDYWQRSLELHDRDRFKHDGPGTVVPISLRAGYPYVDAEVMLADGGRVKGRFLVDVGGSQALNFSKPWIDKHRLRERVSPTVPARGGSGIGGATSHDIGRVPSVHLGDLTVSGPIVHLYGSGAGIFSSGSSAGSIGGDLLRRFVVIIDYKRHRMIFERHAGTDEPFDPDMSGLDLSLDPSLTRLVVEHVIAGSPASDAGLVAGDTIVAVNGEATSAPMLDRLRALFRKRNQRVELTLEAGNERTRRIVTTREVWP